MSETLRSEQELYDLRQKLSTTYSEIETRARNILQQGKVEDNPILTREKQETRYAIATCGLLNGPADSFLETVSSELAKVEPEIRLTPSGFRHIAFREVLFDERGRKGAGIDAMAARQYYKALKRGFSTPRKPVQLELVKVLPSIDREQKSISVVGAFLPVGDTQVLDVRSTISKSIEESGLPLSGRLGEIKVLFSTLGRLPHKPKEEGETIPLLAAIDTANSALPASCTTTINTIDIVSSTPISYMWVDKHVYMIPPISLVKPNVGEGPHFVTASHRKMLRQTEGE